MKTICTLILGLVILTGCQVPQLPPQTGTPTPTPAGTPATEAESPANAETPEAPQLPPSAAPTPPSVQPPAVMPAVQPKGVGPAAAAPATSPLVIRRQATVPNAQQRKAYVWIQNNDQTWDGMLLTRANLKNTAGPEFWHRLGFAAIPTAPP